MSTILHYLVHMQVNIILMFNCISNILFLVARGFRTSNYGNPDESRAARIVLKDFVSVRLLVYHFINIILCRLKFCFAIRHRV